MKNKNVLDFNKTAVARIVAKYAAGERDPSWDNNPALTAARVNSPVYVERIEWIGNAFDSLPENIQVIIAQMARFRAAQTPDGTCQDTVMTALFDLLKEAGASGMLLRTPK